MKGSCTAAGQAGQPCHSAFQITGLRRYWCDSEDLTCDTDRGVCVHLGGEDEPCRQSFTREACDPPLVCSGASLRSRGVCVEGGGAGQRCRRGHLCDAGLACSHHDLCVETAGGQGQACRWQGGCDAGLECVHGTCGQTGGDNQFCRAGDAPCDEGLYCGISGRCRPESSTEEPCTWREFVFCRRCASEVTELLEYSCSYDDARERARLTGTNCELVDGYCSSE